MTEIASGIINTTPLWIIVAFMWFSNFGPKGQK